MVVIRFVTLPKTQGMTRALANVVAIAISLTVATAKTGILDALASNHDDHSIFTMALRRYVSTDDELRQAFGGKPIKAVYAPTNTAWNALSFEDKQALSNDKDALWALLSAHVSVDGDNDAETASAVANVTYNHLAPGVHAVDVVFQGTWFQRHLERMQEVNTSVLVPGPPANVGHPMFGNCCGGPTNCPCPYGLRCCLCLPCGGDSRGCSSPGTCCCGT